MSDNRPVFNEKEEHQLIHGVNGIRFLQNDNYFAKSGVWVKSRSVGARVASREVDILAKQTKELRKAQERAARQNPSPAPPVPQTVIDVAKENAAAASADEKAE